MGSSWVCSCKKCGYNFHAFVGVGILYPKIYCKTVQQMKEGRFGEQGKEFFEAFPNGAISCETIVVRCNDCGQFMEVPELTLYIPKEGFDPKKIDRTSIWSTAFSGKGYDYISFSELDKNYQLYEHYNHRCSNCNGHTTVAEEFTYRMDDNIDRHVHCPECGSMIELKEGMLWD